MANKNTQVIEVVTRGADKSKQQLRGVSGGLAQLAKQAAVAAGAYFGARALLGGIKASIDLFAQQELAEKKLEAALGKTSQKLLNQAKAIQQVTMFGDEQVIEAQALIGSFVREEEAIMSATQATLDLAAAKGMELTVAADLVSKTLGSSTNALSRYGIEVTGAVGSTERLESLTGNLAKVFGGQATEQSQTLSGAIQQMKNAVGDAGEAFGTILSPVVINIAGYFKTAAERASEFFRDITETRLERTIREMQELGISGEALLRLQNLQIDKEISGINKELAQLNEENLTGEEIEKRLNNLAKQKKDQMKVVADLEAEDIDAKTEKFHKEMQFLNDRYNTERMRMEDGNHTKKDFAAQEQRRQDAIQALTDEYDLTQIDREREKLKNLTDEQIGLALVAAKTEEILKLDKTRIKNTNEEIKQEGLLAKLRKEENRDVALKEIQGAASTAKANLINQIMKAVPFPFNLVAAAGAGKSVDKLFSKLLKPITAQYGADFITDGPQMMMVGEGSGPERVQVTPLVDENRDGPQGQGITLNISGNVLHDSFVEDSVVPQIREALRMGENLGA